MARMKGNLGSILGISLEFLNAFRPPIKNRRVKNVHYCSSLREGEVPFRSQLVVDSKDVSLLCSCVAIPTSCELPRLIPAHMACSGESSWVVEKHHGGKEEG
jgi:hypothetical protein